MIAPGFQALAQVAAEKLLNSIPEGLVIAALAWGALRLLKNSNAGARFAVWYAALIAIAAVPFIPSWSAATSLAHVRPELTLPASCAVALFAAWSAVTVFALMRIAVGLWNVRKLRRDATPIAMANLPRSVQQVLQQHRAKRAVTVCTSTKVSVPTAIGFFQAAILLPPWALSEISEEELRVVVLHELAHLRRWDDCTNLLQRMLRNVFCFHPAVWWIEGRLALEREIACDDAVVEHTRDAQVYAECLVSLTEKSFLHRGLAMAQALFGRPHETRIRLARILDGDRPRSSRVWKPAFAVVGALAVVCLAVLPNAPKLVAFESAAAPAQVSRTGRPMLPAGTMMVPARLRTDRPATQLQIHRNLREEGKSGPSGRAEHRHDQRVLRASMPPTQRHYVVVMRTAEYSDNGAALVQFTVWHVTVESAHGEAQSNRVSKT